MELAGSRALVTGGGGGLGAVIVDVLAARGVSVIVADVDGAAALAVASRVNGEHVEADLSSETGVRAVLEVIGGDLDVLVNVAGGWGGAGRSFPESSAGEWEAVLRLNLLHPMRLIYEVRPALSSSPIGAAVSISSSAALSPGAYGSPEYAVAKAGLVRLTSSVADWGERYGVRVSCVVPGWIGLPRAVAEVQAMPADRRPSLIAPEQIAAEVIRLVEDRDSGGEVVVMEEGKPARSFSAPGLHPE
jgi:3-oxoacyl-[acyl-carrier protein] reductase